MGGVKELYESNLFAEIVIDDKFDELAYCSITAFV